MISHEFPDSLATAKSHPRVLIVNGEPASTVSASGITLSNLFHEWPQDRIAQIYTSAVPHEPTGLFEYHVPAASRWPLSWLRPTSSSAPAIAHESGPSTSTASRERGRLAQMIGAAKPKLRPWLDLLPYELPREVEQRIVAFRPQLVFSYLGNIQISRLALRLAQLCQVPLIPHFMDDWISTHYVGRPDLSIHRALLLRTVDSVIAQAPFGLTISGAMATDYSAKFDKVFHRFMNCVPVNATPLAATNAPRLVYVGGLHLDRWRALREIADTVGVLNREGIAGTLTVYAPASDLAEFGDKLANPNIEIGGSLAQSEVPGAIAAADILVHVESFEPALRKYTRLSISTKIPQYAAAGRPLFCYGPQEVASLRFVQENAIGLVVGTQGNEALKSQLRRILEDATLRQGLAENAVTLAQREFDADMVRQRFASVLRSATT